MIETNNPEINVDELMERVRAEAARLAQSGAASAGSRRMLAIALPPVRVLAPPPRLPTFRTLDAKKERIDSILRDAREKSDGNPNIPKMFRRFFRKQGGYNRMLIDAVDRLAKTQAQMTKQLREVSGALETQSQWMRALAEHRQSDATWMRAAAQRISDLAFDLEELAATTGADTAAVPRMKESAADGESTPQRGA